MRGSYAGHWPPDLGGKTVVVVNPLRAYWSLAICSEVAMRAREEGAKVLWVDAPLMLGKRDAESLQPNRQDRWNPLLKPDPLILLQRVLTRSGVSIVEHSESPAASCSDVPRTLEELDRWEVDGDPLGRAVHSSISGQVFRYFLDLESAKTRRQVQHQMGLALTLQRRLRETVASVDPDYLFTTNDRVLPASVALLAARSLGIDGRVAYWGSTPDSLMMYRRSLFSHADQSEHVDAMWSAAKSDPQAIEAAQSFMERQFHEAANLGAIDFRRQMREGHLPIRRRVHRLAFFPSTPWEFSALLSGVEGAFSGQMEALDGILQTLDPQKWEVVVRHHPIHPILGDRGEMDSWTTTTHPNVLHVPGDSPIDSLELAAEADVSVVFNSSIGITLVARQFPTAVTGPAFWARPEWGISARTSGEMSEAWFLTVPKVAPNELLPIANYLSGYGSAFRYVTGQGSATKVDGTRILKNRIPQFVLNAMLPVYLKWIQYRRTRL